MSDIRLGVIEARFADIVWSHAPLTTAELIAHCQRELNWKRTTTYTVLKRLSERGLFQNEGGTVTAKISKEEFYALQSAQFVEENFQGSLPAFLAAFTAKKELRPEEIAEIRRMIDSYGEGVEMKAVFLKLLSMSADASWLILAVLVLRLLLKKAPKAIHCALWALVAIRLVCPFTLESSLSLMPREEVRPRQIITNYAPIEPMPLLPSEPLQTTPTEFVPVEQPADPMEIAGLVWLLGTAAMAAYAGVSCLRLRRRLREAVVWESSIWLCDRIDTPFIFGVIRPRIFLPATLDREQTGFVLAHEEAHLRRRDHWWKPLGFLLLTVYWFNPLSWLAYWLLCRDIELACDEKVVRNLENQEKKDYSMALLTCGVRHTAIAVCPLAFGEVGVKQRVKHVLSYKKPAFWLILLAILVCIAVAVGFLTDPKQEAPPAEPEIIEPEVKAPEEPVPTEPEGPELWPMEEEKAPTSAEYFSQVRELDWTKAAHPIPKGYGVQYSGSEETGQLKLRKDGETIRILPTTAISWCLGSDARWYYAASADRTQLFRVDYQDGTEEVLYTDPSGCLFAGYYIDHTLYFVASVSEETLGIYRLYVPDGDLTVLYDEIPNSFTPGMWRNPISLTPISTVEMEWSYEPDRLNGRKYFAYNAATGAYLEGEEPVHLNQPEENDLEAFLQTVVTEQIPATLTLIQNGEKKSYPAWGCGNDVYLSRLIANLNGGVGAEYRYTATDDLLFDHDLEGSILLKADSGDWTLTFRQGDSWVCLDRNGETRWYEAQPLPQNSTPVGDVARRWFDEAEYWGIGAAYQQQGEIVIPDRGQGYLEAAREYCQAFEGLKLLPSPGSSLGMTYVSCTTSEEVNATTSARERGEIGENTWCFWLDTVFVPANQAAYSNYQAGNTIEYTGNDPDVPDGAYQYGRCGYITLEADGWHGELVGTGW